MRCGKAGCKREATHEVILNDPDGEFRMHSCREHMLAFQQWCAEEVDRQQGQLTSVLIETYGERSP